MLDNFREWLSDNLRYILLGLAILLALVLLFFGVKALTGGFSDEKPKDTEKKTEQKKDSTDSDEAEKDDADKEDENALEKNAYPEVNALIESFYTAWGQKDVAKMKELTDNFDATDEAKVTNATYIESYDNIVVYTKQGLEKDSYVVFVSYDLKFKDVKTAAPGLSELYVIKNDSGNYVIHNDDSDAEVQECIEKTRQEKDVMTLIEDVENKLNEDMASDAELKAFEEKLGKEVNTAQMADNGDMLTANEDCNVRTDSTTNAEILGRLKAGDQVKKLENGEDNWIKVEYNGQEAYVYADLLQ